MPKARQITYNGETHSACYWGRRFGLSNGAIINRCQRGIPLDSPSRKGGSRQKRGKPTLCWTCNNTSTGKCPWFSDFKPVPGWRATKTSVRSDAKSGDGRRIDSYCVHSCPLYDPNIEKIVDAHEGSLDEIAVAVLKQAIDDWRRLSKGGAETKDCNFVELEKFFKHECSFFTGNNKTAKLIWRRMKQERKAAKKNRTDT